MLPTLENALEKISELESRIARLERMVIGSSEPAANPHPPTLSTLLCGDGEAAFPQLNAGVTEADGEIKTATDTKPSQSEITNDKSALETVFPNIAENLTLVWGNPECEGYLNKLMINNRSNRQGFSLDVMSELMLLLAITERAHTDIWADSIKIGD
ncbi:hypothetical protein SCD_n01215 [Sulfuricella denitrificans skB26]|uniref:Uncharacterized protein n=1 Tax=Sulfuricella denitrificans (strain DSM 22764 / NBRC 105220 / skB26) TaxID=1163617 RepID=S6AKB4_SULDS|nr:hypothetical protein [Sulfuricella denitrificans]BAN35044.1 hypothetical protein SCD_n01215 [Sulfuricella denitrificans skB26]